MLHASQPGGYDPRGHYPAPKPPADLKPVDYARAGGQNISMPHIAESQKYAKFAVSALGYEDVPTAIDNLQKALALLLGRENPA